jgi:hypothetical protein
MKTLSPSNVMPREFSPYELEDRDSLVIGSGVYAKSLAQLLEKPLVPPCILDQEPKLESGDSPHLLNSLERILIVADETARTPELLWRFEKLSTWIEKMTSAKECHLFSMLFVLTETWDEKQEEQLASVFGLAHFDPEKGLVVWRRSESLTGLLKTLTRLGKADIQRIRQRQSNQPRRIALAGLKKALLTTDDLQILHAARLVAAEFEQDRHSMDNFCRPPFHPNGNSWRLWISQTVTDGVTPERRKLGEELLSTLNI